MPETHEHITNLLERYIANTATEAEIRQLFLWLKETEDDSLLRERVFRLWEDHQPAESVAPVHRVHFLKTSWFRYAAAVILIIGSAAIWYTIFQNNSGRHFEGARNERVRNLPADIQPGGNKAVLTLADGSKIILDNAQNGSLAQQGATNIIKLDNGQLAYRHATVPNRGMPTAGELLYNTIATPRGGQYQVVLPDGSKVWLNAASSIKFPAAFTNSTREVEVTGEAYLEVAKNTKQPFFVTTRKTTIQVLGTSFNVNAYDDEQAEKTTLVEGSVRISIPLVKGAADRPRGLNSDAIILKPGQMYANGKVAEADTEQTLAWKSGLFKFNRVTIEPIMRQLARWYNLDVKYEGNLNKPFVATIPRNVPISQVLEALEATGLVKFKIEGNRVTVIGQ